jgi:transcriptional regulator with GAF, ATPase, and Fis domain/tetratricopeptide (TPR) repeat protein
MNEWFEGPERPDTGPPAPRPIPDSLDWDRLEEVGDLHFQASSFSSALDYYRRLFSQDHLRTIAPERALDILRKCTITALKIGNLRLAAEFLDQTPGILETDTPIDPEERKRLMAPLIGCRASLHFARGDYARALQLAKHAFAILAVTDRHQEVAMLQITMGVSHSRLGRPEKAEEFYTDALATFRRIGDELGMAVLYNNLALLAKNACRWDHALELMEKAKVLARKHGATHLLSRLHLNEGIILVKLGRLAEGRTALDTCLRLARSLGDRARQTKANLGLGRLEILEGRLARAEELILEGKVQAEQEHFLRESAIADEYLGDILLARGEIEQALFNYGLGLEKSRTIGQVNDLEGELLRRVAEAQRQRGELDLAIESAQASIAVCEKCGELYELGFCHLTLGRAHASRSQWQDADAHLRHAVATFRRQNLTQDWCRAILEYFRIRLETAGQRELLILRRYLLAAQEQAVPAISEELLREVLAALAEVQLRLGQFDDALLTAYELERATRDAKDDILAGSVASLRGRIERGMMGDLEEKGHHLRTIGGISGLFSPGDRSITRNLSSVLQAGLERVKADCGFIAMEGRGEDGGWAIVAREQLSENLAEQLTRWFAGQQDTSEPSGSCLFSRLSVGDPLLETVPALKGHARSCVFMPIAMEGRRFGLLFLGKVEVHGFGRPALDFLSTYMGFLGLFLHEKCKARPFPTGEHIPTPIEGVASFENIITRNEMMLEVLGLIRKVAPSDLTTLLKGETGTGKGLLAYAIHALSRRRDRKFLAINCAAIPETLLESELFGHKKGSFTGAHEDKRGLLAEAEGGTVFLDEIGKMPLSMQGKLLHFLDTKIVRPVGSLREQRVDVRIICASKTDLQELARKGLFLEDLYYRLLDFPLEIPPLRERRDDIPLLIQHFVERFSQELGVESPACGTAFMDALMQHNWPGNVRELEKALKRAIVLAQGERLLRPEHLPSDLVGYDPGRASSAEIPPLKETLAAVECREISQVLKCTRGNKSKAARLLGISYPSLLKKIRFYGIQNR